MFAVFEKTMFYDNSLLLQYYRPKDWIYAALFQACVATKSPESVLELWAGLSSITKGNKLHRPVDFKKFGVRLESNLAVKRIHEALALDFNTDVSDNVKYARTIF